jgi:hypothetical protein
VAAFIAVTVGCELIGFLLASLGGDTLLAALANWVSVFSLGVTQWLVLRRYVPWAQWWALATIAGQGALYTAAFNFLYGQGAAAFGWDLPAGFLFSTLGAQFLAALLLYPTLGGRVPRAWLWLVVVPAAAALGSLIAGMLVPVGPGQAPSFVALIVRTIVRVTPMAVAAAVTLAWMCRAWLDRPAVAPPPRAYSRVEFLIAWCAVPVTAWALLAVLDGSTGRSPRLGLVFLPALFVAVLAAGELWVLAGTSVDFRRWRLVTLVGVGAVVLLTLPVPLLANVLYIAVLVTRAGALGLIPALAQVFAFRTPTRATVWMVAAVVGWSVGYWMPTLVSNIVGPASAYRSSTLSDPAIFGLVAGLLPGLALLPELGSREPRKA